MGKHFPLSLLTPYLLSSQWQSPHQCAVRIGLYTLSSRWGLCIGYRIMKGVSKGCIARLLLTLNDTLIGIESLSSGYLTHCILDPKVLARYLEAIADDMENMAPDYEPVFTDVYQYYGNSLASFTNTIDNLILQVPVLIKLKVQVPMSLYSMDTVPAPLDAETYTGDK